MDKSPLVQIPLIIKNQFIQRIVWPILIGIITLLIQYINLILKIASSHQQVWFYVTTRMLPLVPLCQWRRIRLQIVLHRRLPVHPLAMLRLRVLCCMLLCWCLHYGERLPESNMSNCLVVCQVCFVLCPFDDVNLATRNVQMYRVDHMETHILEFIMALKMKQVQYSSMQMMCWCKAASTHDRKL